MKDINDLYEQYKNSDKKLEAHEITLCEWYEKLVLNKDYPYSEIFQHTAAFDHILNLF